MRNSSTIILATVVVIVTSVFLIGNRFDARWAGGSGHIPPCPAQVVDSTNSPLAPDSADLAKRGQIMGTDADSFAKYELCDGTILYLDTNTQLKLEGYRDERHFTKTQLSLIQGRVLVVGDADIRTRNTVVRIPKGTCELVHYSWLDQLDITPMYGGGCGFRDVPGTPAPMQTSRFNTFDTSLITINPFLPEESAARDFYAWTRR